MGNTFLPFFLTFKTRSRYSGTSPVAQVVKKTACNVGDLGLIPALGRSREKGKGTHSSILAWRTSWTTVHGGHKELDMTE